MLEKVIRDFCRENNYAILENYTGSTFFGEMATTLAIVVKPDHCFEVLAQLTSYLDAKLEAKEIDEAALEELEGANVDYADNGDAQIYFPWVKNYHPLQPKE